MSNPNQIVAERIAAALTERNLLPRDSNKGLSEKLAAGQMGASDWIMLLRLDENRTEQDAKIKDQKY